MRALPGRAAEAADFPVGAVILSSISRDGKKAKDAARSYAATYVVNKVRNIQNDEILSSSGIPEEELAPLRARIASGNEDLTDLVTDSMLAGSGWSPERPMKPPKSCKGC